MSVRVLALLWLSVSADLVVAAGTGSVVTLESPALSVTIDRASGSVTRLISKKSGWALVDTALFGEELSFRALLPLAGGTPPDASPPRRRRNYIDGPAQAAPTVMDRVQRVDV